MLHSQEESDVSFGLAPQMGQLSRSFDCGQLKHETSIISSSQKPHCASPADRFIRLFSVNPHPHLKLFSLHDNSRDAQYATRHNSYEIFMSCNDCSFILTDNQRSSSLSFCLVNSASVLFLKHKVEYFIYCKDLKSCNKIISTVIYNVNISIICYVHLSLPFSVME